MFLCMKKTNYQYITAFNYHFAHPLIVINRLVPRLQVPSQMAGKNEFE